MIEDDLDDDEISGKGKTKSNFYIDLFFISAFARTPLDLSGSDVLSFSVVQRTSKYSCLRI